ncbi:MAG TPA: aminotransferase class I/II-fold pyridoxal phosphate-dependent enzyme [Solirubrobacteraceae bacterium]|nr:aminotransferase class I/II-fold pyridoxal phosphate-dependent enzyme [Solirubrobacteraceae bacterium]
MAERNGKSTLPVDLFAKIRSHERRALLAAARQEGILPYFHVIGSPARAIVEMEGASRIMLGSNNYLGLTDDPRVLEGARDALERYGSGLTGSRLLNGTTPLHIELEAELAEWMGTESALTFTTGHQANLSALSALLTPSDTVIVDTADHASILDGAALARAKLRPFRHNRLSRLEQMLERAASDGGGVLVVVDSVFSMEGDIAPLRRICELARNHGARLMVDEAHGAGVLGALGQGACELLGLADRVDLRMGTFSKSLASCGGFIAATEEVIEYLRITARPFLFTASGVPAALGASLAALRILRSAEGPALLERLLANAWLLHEGLLQLGFAVSPPQTLPEDILPGSAPGVRADADGRAQIVTPIIPILVEDDWKAALLWRALYDAGIFVNTALHPAVPPGGALLRTSVMATHDQATIEHALEIFARVKREFEAAHGPLPQPASG